MPAKMGAGTDGEYGLDVSAAFSELTRTSPGLATAVAAIRVLMRVLKGCVAGTLQELVAKIRGATEVMKGGVDCSAISVKSGGELFLRFITLASSQLEDESFENARAVMLRRGEQFLEKLMDARAKIARLAVPFLTDGSKILVHSHSKCVLEALREAAKANRRLHVYSTQSSFDGSGARMQEALAELGVAFTPVLDASVGYIMADVDCILMGAEGVVESGGIVNKIGSYTISLCAKELNKPVYVLCESFKFVRLYPLGQMDLPDEFKFFASTLRESKDLSAEHPLVDYTPPSYINLLFTDLGILTPSAVSDELLKLYL